MHRLLAALLLLPAVFLAPGCATGFAPRGLIFTRIVEPLDTDLSASPVHPREATGTIMHFEYSWARFLWRSNGIGDVMRSRGMRQGEFADLETLNVLGIWRMYTVRVHGPEEPSYLPVSDAAPDRLSARPAGAPAPAHRRSR